MIDRQQTVANLVLDHSECAEVLQRHRIDFCCRGDLTLEAAAQAKGCDVAALVAELSHAIAARRSDREADPRELPTLELIGHIVSKHHKPLHKVLPFVVALAAKVARVHGEHNPKLLAIDAAVAELCDVLLVHVTEEELSLFPALTARPPDRSAIERQLSAMVDEHRVVARLLERIRVATDEFTLPAWACNSYRTLFSELEALESDVFAHVHLENNVLRPRFMQG